MIGIGSDHHGFFLKQHLAAYLAARGEEVWDFGAFSPQPVDYPDVAAAVAGAVRAGTVEQAVLVCGTGLGMAIAANKVPGVCAAAVRDAYSARRARESNNVQIIALGADLVGPGLACAIVAAWLEAKFHGGESARKVEKVYALEAQGTRELAPTLSRGGRYAPKLWDHTPSSAALTMSFTTARVRSLWCMFSEGLTSGWRRERRARHSSLPLPPLGPWGRPDASTAAGLRGEATGQRSLWLFCVWRTDLSPYSSEGTEATGMRADLNRYEDRWTAEAYDCHDGTTHPASL